MESLVEKVLEGNRRAVARMLTTVENERPEKEQSLAQLYPHTGKAWIIGVTGAPGTGKSSLVNAITKEFRQQEKSVAIIAVDPTSPFSGGAILGDRIRMQDLSGDAGVFIRSMAARGHLGGLARATRDAIRVFDAAGYDVIIIETVGAGQNEVDIVRTAQTTLVVEAPGLGDGVQAIKAGILEIADILVVNKSDRMGSKQTVQALKAMLELGHPASKDQLSLHHGKLVEVEMPHQEQSTFEEMWMPPIVETVATEHKQINELISAIEKHREYLVETGKLASHEEQQIEIELYERLRDELLKQFLEGASAENFQGQIERIHKREISPQSAVREILQQN